MISIFIMVMLLGLDVIALRLREHSLKVKKEQSRLDLRTFTFSQRVVIMWHGVPADEVTISMLRAFKNQLESHLKKLPLPKYSDIIVL